MNEERIGKCFRQVEHIRGHLWHSYSIATKQDVTLMVYWKQMYDVTAWIEYRIKTVTYSYLNKIEAQMHIKKNNKCLILHQKCLSHRKPCKIKKKNLTKIISVRTKTYTFSKYMMPSIIKYIIHISYIYSFFL